MVGVMVKLPPSVSPLVKAIEAVFGAVSPSVLVVSPAPTRPVM